MKNIFKKNQIIIMALAIMIAIAGYLNFSDRGSRDALETANPDVLDYDTSEETAGDDITQSDVFSDDLLLDDTVLDLSDNEDGNTETASEEGSKQTAKEDGKADSKDDAEVVEVSDTGEVKTADNKGKEDKGKEDKGKEDKETSTPGEAVLVSTKTSVDFFAQSRLKREQTRAKSKTELSSIIDSENLTEAVKEDAINKMIALTTIAEKESATETLLEAKGFSDALVTIIDDEVDVVINAASLTEQELAQITDVVTRKTGVDVLHLNIVPTVATE